MFVCECLLIVDAECVTIIHLITVKVTKRLEFRNTLWCVEGVNDSQTGMCAIDLFVYLLTVKKVHEYYLFDFIWHVVISPTLSRQTKTEIYLNKFLGRV